MACGEATPGTGYCSLVAPDCEAAFCLLLPNLISHILCSWHCATVGCGLPSTCLSSLKGVIKDIQAGRYALFSLCGGSRWRGGLRRWRGFSQAGWVRPSSYFAYLRRRHLPAILYILRLPAAGAGTPSGQRAGQRHAAGRRLLQPSARHGTRISLYLAFSGPLQRHHRRRRVAAEQALAARLFPWANTFRHSCAGAARLLVTLCSGAISRRPRNTPQRRIYFIAWRAYLARCAGTAHRYLLAARLAWAAAWRHVRHKAIADVTLA